MAKGSDQLNKIKQLFSEQLVRLGRTFMLIAAPLTLLWSYVDYTIEFEHFNYFLLVRLSYAAGTLFTLLLLRVALLQKYVHALVFTNYCHLVITIGVIVAGADHLTLYSMGFSTVFIGSSLFLIWKPRYMLASFGMVGMIVLIHLPRLIANHSPTDLIVVSAYLITIIFLSVVCTFVSYRSQYKQFVLRVENELYEQELARRLAEVADANEALAAAHKNQQKFFSIIAHDLRGPIGSLAVLFEEVISDNEPMDPQTLAVVRSTTRSVHTLLEQLLAWASSQQGNIRYNPTVFALRHSVEECLALMSGNAKQKGIDLINASMNELRAYADVTLATTVIRNLVNNAVKFCSAGDSIVVSAIATESTITVSVEDTGVGMTELVSARLFKLDQKAPSSLGTSNEGGTGLGLILCKEFVERNGGAIGVESEVGKGSRFWFTLPAARPDSNVALPETEVDWGGLLQGVRVLLAEDSELHATTSMLVLAQLGLDTERVRNGLEAITRSEVDTFDIVLVDVDMPAMNGIDAARLIAAGRKQPRAIIALSSYSEGELAKMSGSVKFAGYLNKPLSRDALLAALKPLFSPF